MNWTTWSILGIVVIGFFLLKRVSFVSVESARQLLRENARIVDVRTEPEFRQEHVPGAINVPLGELEDRISGEIPDRNEVILVHCLSGGRSAIAKSKLRKLGYPRVHNLGSFARALKAARAS